MCLSSKHGILTAGILAGALTLLLAFPGTTPAAVSGLYPLDFCIVSGDPLDANGSPVIYAHEGRDLRFCSADCREEFRADSGIYLEKLDEAIVERQLQYYPLSACIVSGEKLGGSMGEPIDYVTDNRLVRLCCKMCAGTLEKNREAVLQKLDLAIIEAGLTDYPLEVCPISGEKLGGMGEPVDYVFDNRLVRFCCGGCIPAFEKNPAAAMKQLEQEEGKPDSQKPHEGHEGHEGHQHG